MKNLLAWMRSQLQWKLYGVLLTLYILAIAAGIPFMVTIEGVVNQQRFITEMILYVLFGAAVLVIGLLLVHQTGLGAPIIERISGGKPIKSRLKKIFLINLIAVIITSFFIFFLRLVVSIIAVTYGVDYAAAAATTADIIGSYPALWKWFLVSFHASVVEEILFRFGLMNLMVWLGGKLVRTKDEKPSVSVYWGANIIAAVAFGFLHLVGVLPVPDIPLQQASVVIQNAAVGLIFGWFYWKYGLESAMLTHFLLDVFFYVLTTPIFLTGSLYLILGWLVGIVAILIISINKVNNLQLE